MKRKISPSWWGNLLMIAIVFLLVMFVLLIKHAQTPVERLRPSLLEDALEYCDIPISSIQEIQGFDEFHQANADILRLTLQSPIIAELYYPEQHHWALRGIQSINTGLETVYEMPQLMFYDSEDGRLFVLIYRQPNQNGYCGAFEIGRLG